MKKYICSNCGAQFDKPEVRKRGVITNVVLAITVLLTLVTVIIPIIILILDYVEHQKEKKKYCPVCGCEGCLMPTDTPMGRRLVERFADL